MAVIGNAHTRPRSTGTVARDRVLCYWQNEISDEETSKTFPGKSEIGRRSNF